MSEKTLSQVAEEAISTLSREWSDMGFSEAEQNQKKAALFAQISAIFQTTVDREQEERNSLAAQIENTNKEIVSVVSQLGEEPADLSPKTGPLREQLVASGTTLKALVQRKQTRQEEITLLTTELKNIWFNLGSTMKPLGDTSDCSLSYISDLRKSLSEAKKEEKLSAERVAILVKTVAGMMNELDVPKSSWDELDTMIAAEDLAAIGVHCDTIMSINGKIQKYNELRSSRQNHLKQLASEITGLWNKLFIPECERQQFLASHSGLNARTIKACEDELQRLTEMRMAKLPDLVVKARAQLDMLWDEMMVPAEERQKFLPAFSALQSGEILEAIENEALRLQAQMQCMAPLLALIKERIAILEEKFRFEEIIRTNDPARFKNGFPLKYEKFCKKTLGVDLPALETRLEQGIQQWEEANGDFKLNGERFLVTLAKEREAEEEKKQAEKAAKKPKATTIPPATPSKSTASLKKGTPASQSKSTLPRPAAAASTPRALEFGTPVAPRTVSSASNASSENSSGEANVSRMQRSDSVSSLSSQKSQPAMPPPATPAPAVSGSTGFFSLAQLYAPK